MKGELLKRFFRAIASSDQEAIDKLTYLVIEEERSKGHTLLADQLENITKKKPKDQSPDLINTLAKLRGLNGCRSIVNTTKRGELGKNLG